MDTFKEYTFADVSSRNGQGTQPLWIVYKDSVFDLTRYINEHPGGYEAMSEYAGKDASRAFEDVGHSSDARNIMLQYKIGIIVEEERRYDANGKKKKRVVSAPADKPEGASSKCNKKSLHNALLIIVSLMRHVF